MRQSEGPARDRGTGPTEKSATAKSQALTGHRIPNGDRSTVDTLSREFDAGYRLGYLTGHDVGYGAAQYEITTEWLAEIESSPRPAATRGPSLSELRRIRSTLPELRHGQACDCSRCDWIARRGGDHAGGRVQWLTTPQRVVA